MVEAPFRRLFGRPGDGKREEGGATRPRSSTRPSVGLVMRERTFRSVLLPAPLRPTSSATLSFEIVANADVEQADLRVLFFRERAAIRQDYGHRHVGVLSLKRGEHRVVEVAYPSLALAAGDVTVVIFVTPGAKATPREAISEFHRVRMMFEAGDDSGAGLVQLGQSWRVHDGRRAKGERSSRISV